MRLAANGSDLFCFYDFAATENNSAAVLLCAIG